jgi:hypothetical protein
MEHHVADETKTKGFFNYVFHMNDTTKHRLINLCQFITLAFIFLTILLQLFHNYYPIIDETKSSIEIVLLLLFYLYIFFFVIYYITRIICYIPTISGQEYDFFHNSIYLLPLTLSVITSTISYNSNFKEGIFILFDRMTEAWNGGDKKKKKKKTQEQPSQENISAPQVQMISQPIAPLYTGNTTPIHQLPPPQEGYQNYSQNQEYQTANIPMAANEMGSAFSSF